MFFDIKLITILFFIVINFAILFFIKTNINKALSLIFSYLVMVLFLSIAISNYDNLKEIIALLTIYLAVILFLVFNCDSFILEELQKSKIQKIRYIFLIIPTSILVILIVFFSTFWIVKNISEISVFVEEKKIEIKNRELFGVLKSSSGEVKIDEVKEIAPNPIAANLDSQSQKIQDKTQDKDRGEFNMNIRKRVILKDKLSSSFLLKRSSDLILFIMALSIFPMLMLRKKEI